MDNAIYALLNRQTGLLSEFEVVANNIANASTTGFRREGVVFAEHVRALDPVEPDLALADAVGKAVDLSQAPLRQTNNPMDFAIEGPGFFTVGTAQGPLLTRAGAFVVNEAGEIVAMDGARLLDLGGAPIAVPQGSGQISLGADGTLSTRAGPLAQVGIVLPADPLQLSHVEGTRFSAGGATVPADEARVIQGFVEGSNAEPLKEIARMIEVQRSYELGQSLLTAEDDRIRGVISTLGTS